MQEKLGIGSDYEILQMKATTINRMKKLTVTFKRNALQLNIGADMLFSSSLDDSSPFFNCGNVFSAAMPYPSNCMITGKGLKVAVVGEKSSAVLQALDYLGQQCEESIGSFQCVFVSEITGATVTASVEKIGRGLYMIEYYPTVKGRNQLHITFQDQHIRGSPFPVAVTMPVTMPVKKLGYPITAFNGVTDPWGVAVVQSGKIVVTESDKHSVSVFSPNGEKIGSLSTLGSGQDQLNCPRGVSVDREGNILVADMNNHRILKFLEGGQLLAAVGTKGRGPLRFDSPLGLAFNASNNKLYVIDGNHCIQVLNSDLTFSWSFGRKGSDKGEFDGPQGIACDGAGNVYVADTFNDRIQIFTASGKFLRTFRKRGLGRADLSTPRSLAVDNADIIYVSEIGGDSISLFSSEGELIASIENGRSGIGSTTGLAMDDSGVLYVCDCLMDCIHLL